MDILTMANSKEILQHYRDHLEMDVKIYFHWQWEENYHEDNGNGQRKGIELTTVTQAVHTVSLTFY